MCASIPRPAFQPHKSILYFFRENIMPAWEDPANKGGGSLSLDLRNVDYSPFSELLFMSISLLIIGNTLPKAYVINGVSFNKGNESIDLWVNAQVQKKELINSLVNMLNPILETYHGSPLTKDMFSFHLHAIKS